MTQLSVPIVSEDEDALTAAIKYAAAGWYVLPVKRGTKHPGSVVGGRWQQHSSRDTDQLVAWYAGTDYGIALHCGRSGAVVLDIDSTPSQSTRRDHPDRRHCVFLMPPGRRLGNGTGRLGGAWGEVRGLNGVIVVAPTVHPDGGAYRWCKAGDVAVLPDEIAALLPDVGEGVGDAASDLQVEAFLRDHTEASHPNKVGSVINQFRSRLRSGESRHAAAIVVMAWAMDEARAGTYSAQYADERLREIFRAHKTDPADAAGRSVVTPSAAATEWAGIRAWAVGQAIAKPAARVEQIRERAHSGGGPDLLQPATREEFTEVTPRRALDLSEPGNADRMVETCAATLRYCPDTGRWLQWDGRRWLNCSDDGQAKAAARAVVDDLPRGSHDKSPEAKHRARSRSRQGIDNTVVIARADSRMRVAVAQLDGRPHELNTTTGIVDLRTGELRPHSPESWHTKLTGCGYTTDAPAPAWSAFLAETFGGDGDLTAYMQQLAGLAAIGEVREHTLPFLFGGGKNGKSVLMDVLTAVLGDYAITAPANFLLAGREKHETEIARLHGARMVVCSEINADSKFDEAKVKVLTGGDVLSGRFMRQDFFDFVPSHSLFLMGNHQPQVTAGGTSFWRRCKVVPFMHTVPEDRRNPNLAAELIRDEGGAILAWIVDGARQVLSGGLMQPPRAVAEATGEYSDDTKSGVERFLAEVCTVGGDHTVEASAAHASYRTWAMHNGEPVLSIQKFGLDIRAAGVLRTPRTSSGARYRMRVHTERLPSSKQIQLSTTQHFYSALGPD